ncbi:hypothetical protein GM661_12200 [Iocasia frigidifontis]|uniref:Lipoprotein n=1 Tax=Iocasia fonsfrigidae TaxID=2682810 RepID=A0A8A7KBR0_9FIRM|nr:hypothetical protein [Iocasia fonsfrigidae]QTL98670.1 hypothetical protein GM661_12200 [Iocasia fonsfrigidae]
MERKLKKVVLLLLIPLLIFSLTACKGSHNEEAVRAKMEKALYKEYGEEFVVERIGTRSDNSGTYYEARIYPKSIIGTSREGDPYYCAQAGVKKKSLGRLGEVGAGYETVQIKLETEDYLRSKTKEVFGDRIRLKLDVKYKLRKEGNDYFSWQIVSGFKELLKKANTNPDKHRIELELYVYIFDRIDNDEEKEERRKQIFDYVQYLKGEGLFKYLELGVIFIDERVLAPSYWEYARDIYPANLVEKEVEGEIVYLPPRDLRKEMSEVLQREIDEMSEEELLVSMGRIRKSELSYKGINKYNEQFLVWVCSLDMLKVTRKSTYEKYKEENKLGFHYYKTINNILFGKDYRYIYLN